MIRISALSGQPTDCEVANDSPREALLDEFIPEGIGIPSSRSPSAKSNPKVPAHVLKLINPQVEQEIIECLLQGNQLSALEQLGENYGARRQFTENIIALVTATHYDQAISTLLCAIDSHENILHSDLYQTRIDHYKHRVGQVGQLLIDDSSTKKDTVLNDLSDERDFYLRLERRFKDGNE